MKQVVTFTFGLFIYMSNCFAQTDIKAWYAKGQVWIVWNTGLKDQAIFEIYESDIPFTTVRQAQLIGRLFPDEWKAGALRNQVKDDMKAINFRVPKGNSTYRLASREGLFVNTPHSNGYKYYAVVKRGDKLVTPNVNGTDSIRHWYDPSRDPVQCHAQLDTFWRVGNNRYKGRYYYMWADGRQDDRDSRPDFPVMANVYKNGMPSMFIISEALNMDTTMNKKIPATLWLHGGGGSALASVPGSREQINIIPSKGILVAHNDDFFRIDSVDRQDTVLGFHSNTWFFGWARHENPFDNIYFPQQGDTIINYTQRRLIWINDWLVRNYRVDQNMISVNGHSMGSAGCTALMKAYPQMFATATIFNNGLDGPDTTDQGYHLFGDSLLNLPTNLRRRGTADTVVRIYQAFNLNDRNATERDLPLVRMYHGKNDNRGLMKWDAFVVQEYKKADSIGWGMQLYWSERRHGLESCWDSRINDHWSISGGGAATQTFRDNVAYEETFRSDISYPGFFNHRHDPKNHDPGDGTPGTDSIPETDSSGIAGTGAGHDWGTWGGYHEWNRNTIVDEPGKWRVTAWLTGRALYAADISPNDHLTADVSIRRPRRFKPVTGTLVNWYVIDTLTADTLQRGMVAVSNDSLVVIPGVNVYKETIRKVYIAVSVPLPAQQNLPGSKPLVSQSNLGVENPRAAAETNNRTEMHFPNPVSGQVTIVYRIASPPKSAFLFITDSAAKPVRLVRLGAEAGSVTIDAAGFAGGMYNLMLIADGRSVESKRMMVVH